MVASCMVLVGISYLMLDILSGMVVTPRTPVREVDAPGALYIPSGGGEIAAMQASRDGRFLAYVALPGAGDGLVLHVVETGSEPAARFERGIGGSGLAWLGDGPLLLYEDAGDIHALDAETGEVSNLTASPERDSDPLPSPDGRYILWTVSPPAESGESPAFWLMRPDGTEKTYMAPAQPLAVWDPSGGRVMSRGGPAASGDAGHGRCRLRTATVGRAGWEYYGDCGGEVAFIWWPSREALLCVGPLLVKGEDVVKGVWSRVEGRERSKKVASSDGLGHDAARYAFFPSRRGAKLAYVGEKGLEYLDYEERVISRYPRLEARTPLAWNEVAGEIFYTGPEGIYRVEMGGE